MRDLGHEQAADDCRAGRFRDGIGQGSQCLGGNIGTIRMDDQFAADFRPAHIFVEDDVLTEE